MRKAVIAAFVFSTTIAARAQHADAETSLVQHDSSWYAPRYQYEPWPLEPGKSVWTFGLSLSVLPQPVVESEVPAPALEAQYKYGLSEHFTLGAALSTNVFTSVLQTGLQWNDRVDRFSYAAGANAGIFYGWLSIEGQFDKNWAIAVAAVPVMRVGYRFDEFSISAALASTLVIAGETHVGTLRATGTTSPLNDVFLTLAVEQPFLRSSYISLGLSVNYSRTPYQSWILFNTLDQYLLIPEVFVGIQL